MTTITLSDKSKAIAELHASIDSLLIQATNVSAKQQEVINHLNAQFNKSMQELSGMHRDILEKICAAETAIEKIMKAPV